MVSSPYRAHFNRPRCFVHLGRRRARQGLPHLRAVKTNGRQPMSRTIVNLLLDTALLAIFGMLVLSAVIVRFIFPPGPDAKGWHLWSLDFDQWVTVQFAVVSVFALGILLHV